MVDIIKTSKKASERVHQTVTKKPGRTSPIAARALNFLRTDRGPRASDQGSGKVAGKVWIVDRGAAPCKTLISVITKLFRQRAGGNSIQMEAFN